MQLNDGTRCCRIATAIAWLEELICIVTLRSFIWLLASSFINGVIVYFEHFKEFSFTKQTKNDPLVWTKICSIPCTKFPDRKYSTVTSSTNIDWARADTTQHLTLQHCNILSCIREYRVNEAQFSSSKLGDFFFWTANKTGNLEVIGQQNTLHLLLGSEIQENYTIFREVNFVKWFIIYVQWHETAKKIRENSFETKWIWFCNAPHFPRS